MRGSRYRFPLNLYKTSVGYLFSYNEKHCGNALLLQKFTVDFLTKEMKKNEGEIPQYFVEGSHPAIIEPDAFDAVQAELERRNELGRPMGCGSPFSARIVCGDCGGWYG